MLFFRKLRRAASANAEISPEIDQAYALAIEPLLTEFDPDPTKNDIGGSWLLVKDLIQLDLASAKAWASRGLTQGGWSSIDFASGFVNTVVPLGVPDPVARIDSFDRRKLAQVVDLPQLISNLDLIEDDRNLDFGYDTPATPENRLLATRQALADFEFSQAERDS